MNYNKKSVKDIDVRGKRVLLHRFFHIRICYVGVDLRGVELLVTENFFEHANVYVARLIH